MTTANDLIEEVLEDLMSGSREVYNRVLTATTAESATVEVTETSTSIQPGAVLEVGEELMYVWEYDQASRAATVERGFRATVPAALVGGEFVTVNPRFTRRQILRELNHEIRSLAGNGLFWIDTLDLQSSTTSLTYPLSPPDLLGVYDVTWDPTGPENAWPRPTGGWNLKRQQVTDDFPTGFVLRFHESFDPGRTIRVLVKRDFAPFATAGADVTTTHVPASAVDILPLGAQLRLMGVREARRTFGEAQGDSRRAEEAAVGSASQSASVLLNLRTLRMREEKMKLTAQYPIRRR